jgi:hypothetical protein
MFYLGNFFKSLLAKPLAAIMWGLTLSGLASTVIFKEDVESFLGSQKIIANNPYFYAVVPAEINTSYIQRKLKNLPGVETVALLAKEQVGEQVKAILENTLENSGVSWEEDLSDLNYAGLKVALSPDLQARSQDLIRNYLSRLAGGKDVTMGAVKKPLLPEKTDRKSYSRALGVALPSLLVLFYLISLLLMKGTLGKSSFLLETYQRKRNVFEKSLFFGQAPILCFLIYGAFYNGTSGMAALLVYLLGMILVVASSQTRKQWI